MKKRFLKFLDENKDGVINFKTEWIPFLYTVFVGYMVYKEAQYPGEIFTDMKFIAIVGGSLGIEFIRAMAAIYKNKKSRHEEYPGTIIDPPVS